MQTLTEILDKKLESPSLEDVLASCKAEGIEESEIATILEKYLNGVQAKKRTEAHWEKVRQSDIVPLHSPESLREWFSQEYKRRYGCEFCFDQFSEPLITLLCQYFTNDLEFEKSGEYSLKKGLLLFGNVGTGKSSLLQTFSKNQKQSFRMINCLDVASEFSKNGYDGLIPFTKTGAPNHYKHQHWGQSMFTWCFDDLGVESEKKHYGNESNVMADVVQMIYDQRALIGNIHFTTNLTGDQIVEIYGRRVASRLREMVNMIEFDPHSPDRRA